MHFSKSLEGSKSAITMRPVSIETTLLLFLLIQNFLGLCILTTHKYIKKIVALLNLNILFSVRSIYIHIFIFIAVTAITLFPLLPKKFLYSEFFWSYFPKFGLNTEIHFVDLCIQSNCQYRPEKFRTRAHFTLCILLSYFFFMQSSKTFFFMIFLFLCVHYCVSVSLFKIH